MYVYAVTMYFYTKNSFSNSEIAEVFYEMDGARKWVHEMMEPISNAYIESEYGSDCDWVIRYSNDVKTYVWCIDKKKVKG